MVLTLHHLHRSQSERITFLFAELQLPYNLITYPRDPSTGLSPPALKAIHPSGTSPVLVDDDPPCSSPTATSSTSSSTTIDPSTSSTSSDPTGISNSSKKHPVILAESGAIIEYIIHVHASGHLSIPPTSPLYPQYILWFHFANATLFPAFSRNFMLSRIPEASSSPVSSFISAKLENSLTQFDQRLATNKYLAGGDTFTAADIMNVFCLSTMRGFFPIQGFEKYSNILRWLGDIGKRPGYQEAMRKGDPQIEPLLGAEVQKFDWGPK